MRHTEGPFCRLATTHHRKENTSALKATVKIPEHRILCENRTEHSRNAHAKSRQVASTNAFGVYFFTAAIIPILPRTSRGPRLNVPNR
jgi:hypothetical protein